MSGGRHNSARPPSLPIDRWRAFSLFACPKQRRTATRQPIRKNSLTPLFPLDRSHSPVSPLFPLDTKNRAGTPSPGMTNLRHRAVSAMNRPISEWLPFMRIRRGCPSRASLASRGAAPPAPPSFSYTHWLRITEMSARRHFPSCHASQPARRTPPLLSGPSPSFFCRALQPASRLF